jgi:uncharacterized protein YxjI
MLEVRFSSRVFTSGFDISTPLGGFSTKGAPDFPIGEILVLDHAGNQVARLGLESFLSSVYNIIITGGGFYQFGRDGNSKRTWTCKGEERLLCLSERNWRKFFISEGTQEIAEFSKAWYTSDYAVSVSNDADLKLVICIIIALNESENPGSTAPM